MTHLKFHWILCMATVVCSSLAAQELPQLPGAEKEHQFLRQFAGQWDSESEATMGPGQPPVKCTGSTTSKMLGDFWVVSEATSEMMGTSVTAIQTIGYDPSKKKYVGTWIDSMLNHMWNYEGTVDESGKKMTLETEGPNFMTDGKLTKFRDAYEFKSADHIVATSSMMDENGQWVQVMTGNLHRKK